MRKMFPLVLASVVALAAVAAEQLVFSGTVEDWNDDMMDEITFVQPGPWGGAYDVVEVEPVDMSSTELSGKDKGKTAAEEAAKVMDAWCQKSVREGYGEGLPKMVSSAEAPSSSDARVLILRWRCDAIDPGSRAKRFWVGFGVGHGGVTLSGSLVDKASGQELVTFSHRRLSGRGLVPTGGIYAHVLEEAGTGSAEDVGRMLAVVTRTKPGS